MVHCHQRRRDRCTEDYEGWGDSFQPGDSHPVPCHTRAITAGIQGTLQAARDRETRREPSTYPCVRAVPKLTVRVRFPSPAPHTKSVATEANPTISLKQVNAHSRSDNGTCAITRALSHLGECPWRLSVPKLTVRLQFPSPAPQAKALQCCSRCSGEEFLYCVAPIEHGPARACQRSWWPPLSRRWDRWRRRRRRR